MIPFQDDQLSAGTITVQEWNRASDAIYSKGFLH